jgi:glycosyltransferase involved in cell wall biosynthesis
VIIVRPAVPADAALATYAAELEDALERRGRRARVVALAGEPSAAPAPSAAADCGGYDALLLHHDVGLSTHDAAPGLLDLLDSCRKPAVSILHTVPLTPSPHDRQVIDGLVRRSAAVVVHTRGAAERVVAQHPVDPRRVIVVPHGARRSEATLPTTAQRPVAVTWGSDGSADGLQTVIGAVARLRAAGTEVRLVVGWDGSSSYSALAGGVREAARRAGVADLVDVEDEIRPWQSLRRLVRECDVVVLPTGHGSGLTAGLAAEALAAGRPLVGSSSGDLEGLDDSGAMLRVPSASVSRCAGAINAAITDARLRERLQAAARACAAAHDWDVVAARLDDLLSDVTSSQLVAS